MLARIDPTTYQAQLDQAVAKKAQDEATLANAGSISSATTGWSATNSVARQQLDTQKATVAQLEAQVKLDQAAIDNAKAILDYTTIAAPIDGRTGIRQVDEGNIVRGSDATGIVVHHPASADLGAVHPAAAAARRRQPRVGRRARCRSKRSAPTTRR